MKVLVLILAIILDGAIIKIMTILPIVTQPLNDFTVVPNTTDTRIDLFTNFDDPSTSGLIARFDLYNTNLGGGTTELLLFDQPGVGAPITVQNFIGYVERNDYLDSIIHRSVPGFIIQGGGFAIDGIGTATGNGLLETVTVITGPAIQNEFSLDRSNLRGTIAMAKIGGDPDSATSQWFFNLADNSTNLDNQNGGFTVFGQTLSEADLAPLDAIAALPRFNATQVFGQSAFGTMPLNLTDSNELTSDNQLVRYEDIIVFSRPELTFTILNNSNPTLVNASIEEGELILDYSNNQVGTAEITIQATTLLGESTQDTFVVTIEDTVVVIIEDPVITSTPEFSVTENSTSVGTIVATDADADILTYSISGGDDAARFTISSTGELSFVAAPDFEAPADTDADNIYNVQVSVTDGIEAVTQDLTITVTGVAVENQWILDIDGDARVGALSDGIMAVRYLFGTAFAGNALINGAISPSATRSLTDIQNYLQNGVDQKFLDIDGDGRVGALSDGIIAVRYLFGAAFAGNALINGAISPDATRDLTEIQNYLADLTTIA